MLAAPSIATMTVSYPTRRDLRLGSGLVLFVYVALHLANHAIGLVSVNTAERGLIVAVAFWHSVPGTLLLYSAAAIHVALAFEAIYQRRTLRMPPLEILRILLGLGIPILLIGHAVNTRLAWEVYRQSPDYARVVWALWVSGNEVWQLALLVPGWLHGCLGVNFAFGHRRWYQRVRPVLFAGALLLPVLGGLGFLAMGKELAADPTLKDFLDSNVEIDPATRAALARIRDGALALYFATIAAVFAARQVRAVRERRHDALVAISYPGQSVTVPRGWSVLEASRAHLIAHVSMCGGRARCSTCRVQVTQGAEHCPPPGPAELATLTRIDAPAGVRLACQLCPTGAITVVPLLSDASTSRPDASDLGATERDLAVVLVEWHNRASFARSHLPQDVVYLSRIFGESVIGAARSAGGIESDVSVERIVVVFGIAEPLAPACKHALAASRSIQRALEDLRGRSVVQFGATADFSILVHAGHGAIDNGADQQSRRLVGAGDVFDAIETMHAAATDSDRTRIVVSAIVLEQAGVPLAPLAWRPVVAPLADAPLIVTTLAAEA